MTTNQSTEAQRRFIESLARGKSTAELVELLASPFRNHIRKIGDFATLNQALGTLTKSDASNCITILKGA
jgi:hypothetical protein